MNTYFKKIFAIALATGVITIGHSVAAPAPAEAGIIGSIKSAAKSVGGAAKAVGGAVKSTAKDIGHVAKVGAKLAAKLPPVDGVIKAGKAVKVVILKRK